jgi:hypothetical protein
MATYGAFVTVKFWCPNLFHDGDPESNGMTPDELVKYLIKEEGIIGLEDRNEITLIDIREQFELHHRNPASMFAIGIEHKPDEVGVTFGPLPNLAEVLKEWGGENHFIFEFRGEETIKRYQWDNDLNLWQAVLPGIMDNPELCASCHKKPAVKHKDQPNARLCDDCFDYATKEVARLNHDYGPKLKLRPIKGPNAQK